MLYLDPPWVDLMNDTLRGSIMLVFPGPLYCRVYEDTWLLLEGGFLYIQVMKTFSEVTVSSVAPTRHLTCYDHCISFIDGISSSLAIDDDDTQDSKMGTRSRYHQDLSLALVEAVSQVNCGYYTSSIKFTASFHFMSISA